MLDARRDADDRGGLGLAGIDKKEWWHFIPAIQRNPRMKLTRFNTAHLPIAC